jgi:hypothetical protein
MLDDHAWLRGIRKGLLSDLSGLVKLSRQLREADVLNYTS